MKRPEGFDPTPLPSTRRGRTVIADPEGTRKKRPDPVEKRPLRPVRASTSADAKTELRAASKIRKRAERAEIRRFTEASRRRRTAWLIALGSLAALALIVTLAIFSPALALRNIEIEGADRLEEAELVAALEGELGQPLAFLDETRIADDLSGFALIRSFVIELAPPDTLRVRIDEREPIGVVLSGTVFQLVDPAGIVVDTSETRPDGVPLLDLPLGDDGTVRRAVAEVLVALPFEVLEKVDRITATTRDDVSFTLRGSDQRVVWGSASDPERKALVLDALLDKWGGKGPGEYDVSGSGSATFREL